MTRESPGKLILKLDEVASHLRGKTVAERADPVQP